ncbi:PEP-CTERM system histidine kinase PrsK [soil metagenome]
MDMSGTVLAVYGYGFAALAYGGIALYLIRQGTTQSGGVITSRFFTAAILASALWAISALSYQYIQSNLAYGWTSAADSIRYGLWFAFLVTVIHAPGRGAPLGSRPLVYVAGLLLISRFVFAFAGEPVSKDISTFERIGLFDNLALPVFGLVLIEQIFRNISNDARWNAKPLCLGLTCIFLFDLYMFSEAALFGRFDSDAVDIRGFVHAIAIPLLLTASRRDSAWISKLQVSRSAAFHSATLLLAGVYLIFISAIGYYVRYFGGEWGRALQIGLLALGLACLAILILSGSMRSKLRVIVGKHFFSYRYDYRQEWLRFTATLASKNSPHEMGGLVIHGLADLLESPAGGLWSRASGSQEYVQTAQWNMPRLENAVAIDSRFSRFLLDKGWIVDINEFRVLPGRYENLEMPTWILGHTQFWLLVPLIVGDDLIGFVILAQPRTAMDLNWEVTDLLKTASRQAASFLAQMHATEALLEVRKFDAFNRMSAFVVHDLKNIVTQLSLMLKNAKRLHGNPEFQQDMLTTVESSLEKMRQLMLQLREGEAPAGGLSGVDLAPIVKRIQTVAASRGRVLELQVVDRVVTRGHEERVERVVGHVVQNALDATPVAGRVWLRLDRVSGQARLQVGDTGHGMTPEFLQSQLFRPFQTTKQAGMGIGAYESSQYVQELGGRIAVESQIYKGTIVTILLPLFEARQESDLHVLTAK